VINERECRVLTPESPLGAGRLAHTDQDTRDIPRIDWRRVGHVDNEHVVDPLALHG
jgi:hypothetical protein